MLDSADPPKARQKWILCDCEPFTLVGVLKREWEDSNTLLSKLNFWLIAQIIRYSRKVKRLFAKSHMRWRFSREAS